MRLREWAVIVVVAVVIFGGSVLGASIDGGGMNDLIHDRSLTSVPMSKFDLKLSVIHSDGRKIILTPDQLYDLVEFTIAVRKRERENGACVPIWEEYPHYPPMCSFELPQRLRESRK